MCTLALQWQHEILHKPTWKIIIFSPVNTWRAIAFASHKVDIFVMHKWCPLYRDSTMASKKTRWVQTKILVLIIYFFYLNFTIIEIEGERVSSSQNECTLRGGLGGGDAQKQTRTNKRGGGRGRGRSKHGNLEWTYFLNVSFKFIMTPTRGKNLWPPSLKRDYDSYLQENPGLETTHTKWPILSEA